MISEFSDHRWTLSCHDGTLGRITACTTEGIVQAKLPGVPLYLDFAGLPNMIDTDHMTGCSLIIKP